MVQVVQQVQQVQEVQQVQLSELCPVVAGLTGGTIPLGVAGAGVQECRSDLVKRGLCAVCSAVQCTMYCTVGLYC